MRVSGFLFSLLVLMNASLTAKGMDGGRPFATKDAIRVTSVEAGQGGQVTASPDGRRFFVVESYGDLDDGSRVFTIRVFGVNSDETQRVPAELASTSLRTKTNESGVIRPRWTADGHTILFLGVEGENHPQPYLFEVDKNTRKKLLPGNTHDVVDFDYQSGTCAFIARTQAPPKRTAGWSLSDESLVRMLFPEQAAEYKEYALFLSRNGELPKQITPAKRSMATASGVVSVSPDGRWVIASMPPKSVPKEWAAYVPSDARITVGPAALEAAIQYQLVNAADGSIRPLVDAPLGFLVADLSTPKVVWDEDSKSAYLSNTMEPIRPGTPVSRRPAVLKANVTDAGKTPEVVLSYNSLASGERVTSLHQDEDGEGLEIATFARVTKSPTDGPRHGRTRLLGLTSSKQGWVSAEKANATPTADKVDVAGGKVWVQEDANHPPELMFGRSAEDVVRIHDFNPWLREVHLQPISQVQWQDREGHTWTGGLVLPSIQASKGKYPLILALKFHDPKRFSPDGPYTTTFATQALAARGFAVIELDAADAATYETEREGSMQRRGIESAIDFAVRSHNVDEERVGLIGFSRTSYYVVNALVFSDKKFAAATLSDGLDGGYVQFQSYTLNHFGGVLGKAFARMQGGEPFGKGLDAWQKNAAMFNLERVKTPLRIEMIGRSSVLQEWELYSSLKLLHKPVEAYWIPGGTHVLVKPEERYVSAQSTVEWFDFWINGRKSDTPLEAGQYERWTELKNMQMPDRSAASTQ